MAAPAFKRPNRIKPKIDSQLSEKAHLHSVEPEPQEESLGHLRSHVHEDGEAIWLMSYSDLMTLLFGFFVMLMSFSKIDVETFEKARKETTELFGGDYQKPHQEMVEKMKGEADNSGMTDKAFFDELEKGIAITFRGSVFFDAGSAEIKPEAKLIIEKIIPIVKKQKTSFNIVVEGHTDDSPISTEQFPSNWELSSHRASAVLRIFEENGFARKRLRSIGFSDTLPVVPNRNKNGSAILENQNQNRRVVIKLIRSQN